MIELWKTIDGYTDYQVSNLGKIKSLKHNKEKILKQIDNGFNYLYVYLCKNNICQTFYIHRLVGIAFIPNTHNKPCINHKDGNKQNNYVDNLEWCTHSENMKHAFKIGLRNQQGNNSPNHKLNKNDVLIIRDLYLYGNSQNKISKIYGVSRSCIEHIVNRINWK